MPRIAILTALFLAGCVSMTAPVSVGKDTYMMGLGAHGGFESDAELMAKTLHAASDFCAVQHRTMEVQSTSASGTQMWTPQNNEVVFKCLAS